MNAFYKLDAIGHFYAMAISGIYGNVRLWMQSARPAGLIFKV